MACSTVDDRIVGKILAVVDHDGPEVHEDKKRNISHLLKGENEGEHMVGDRLSEAIKRMEGMARKRGGHDPLVVSLVKMLVDEWVVKPSMDPVDAEVGKDKE